MPHHELKQLPDGKIEVKLETGETFSGDPLEVTAKLADSKVETRRHYEAKEAELLAKQPEPQPEPAQPQTTDEQWRTYIANQNAQFYGYKNAEEMKADIASVKAKTAEFENHAIVATFQAKHPEYPDTPEANDAIVKLINQSYGGVFNPKTLEGAHYTLINEGVYKPLDQTAIDAANGNQSAQASLQRATPPPSAPRGSNPEATRPITNEWSMPLDELRKRALGQ